MGDRQASFDSNPALALRAFRPPAAEFGRRRRRKIYGRRKSAEKNSAGHNPAVKNNSTAARLFSGG